MKIVIEASPQELLELGVSTDAEMRTKVLRSITQQAAHDVANPAPAGGQGAQDDYRKWYEEAMAASNEAGYAGMDAASTINALSDELRVVSQELAHAKEQGSAPMRTDAEIVEQTEKLAAKLMSWRWGQQPEVAGMEFRNSENTKAQGCWTAACKIQELITGADVENAVAEVDGVDPEFLDQVGVTVGDAHAPDDSDPVVEQAHPEPSQPVEHENQVGAHAMPRVTMGVRRMAARTPRTPGAGAQAQAESRQAPSAPHRANAQPQDDAKPVASASIRAAASTPPTTAAASGPVRRRMIGG